MTNGLNAAGDSKIWRRLAPMRVLLATLAVQILVSCLFILGFCHTFKISTWLLAVHLPLAMAFYAASFFLPALLLLNRRIGKNRLVRYSLGLFPGVCFACLLILYAADFASYRWLGANINYEMAQVFLADLVALRQMVPLPPRAYFWLAVFVIMLLSAFVVLAPKLFTGVEALLLSEYEISFFRTRTRARNSFATIAVLLFAYGGYLYWLRQRAPYSQILSNDPIVSFARNTTGFYDEGYPAYVAKLREDEQRCRANYVAPKTYEAKNIVIIVGDSLRPDHMSAYGYGRPTTPFLDNLFKTGMLSRVSLATSTCSETACGLLSTLNSKTLKRQIPENFKLQEVLQNLGYESFFILAGNHNLGNLRQSYGNEMSLYFDGNSSAKYDVNDDRLLFEGLDRVPTHRNKPAFFLFYLMSPHILGIKQPEFRVYNPSNVETDWGPFLHGQLDPATVVNNYDNRILQTDAMIKGIFAALEQKQYLQNSVVIILSDHGESLGERGEYGHVLHLYQEYISIPMLIYDPQQVKYGNLEFATQIDIAPTIVDRLKLPIPSCWEGNSLLNAHIRSVSRHRTTLRNPCFAIIQRTEDALYKYIYCTTGKTEELYDLTRDPNERTNLMATADPSLIQKVRAEVQRDREH